MLFKLSVSDPRAVSDTAWQILPLAAMLYAAAILYASLVLGPDGLHYVALDPGEAWRRFRAIALIGNASDQRADWIANMLMTIPLGYCLRGILTPNGGERRADALTLLVSLTFILAAIGPLRPAV